MEPVNRLDLYYTLLSAMGFVMISRMLDKLLDEGDIAILSVIYLLIVVIGYWWVKPNA